MSPRTLRRALEALVDAVQIAVGLAAQVRRSAQTTVDEAVALDAAIAQAVAVLRRVQPKRGRP